MSGTISGLEQHRASEEANLFSLSKGKLRGNSDASINTDMLGTVLIAAALYPGKQRQQNLLGLGVKARGIQASSKVLIFNGKDKQPSGEPDHHTADSPPCEISKWRGGVCISARCVGLNAVLVGSCP